MNTRIASAGFTLIEMLAVTALISILLVAYYSPQITNRINETHRQIADTVANEMDRIASAAQSFALDRAGQWPGQVRDCRTALVSLRTAGYLIHIDEVTPWGTRDTTSDLPFLIGGAEPRHLGRYYTECPEVPAGTGQRRHLLIRLALAPSRVQWQGYIQNQVAGAMQVSNADHKGLEVSAPLPAAIPALEGLLPRDGSRAMDGDLDLGEHDVENAENVFLRTGQSLANVAIFHGGVTPGAQITKPDCPEGYTPTIAVAPVEFAHSTGLPISRVALWAENRTNDWKVKSEVYAIGPDPETDSDLVRGIATVRCQI